MESNSSMEMVFSAELILSDEAPIEQLHCLRGDIDAQIRLKLAEIAMLKEVKARITNKLTTGDAACPGVPNDWFDSI